MPNAIPLHPQLMYVWDLTGTLVRPVHLAFDIEFEQTLQGEEHLKFKMWPNDPKLDWVEPDANINYPFGSIMTEWIVSKIDRVREGNQRYVQFDCNPNWYRLADRIWIGNVTIINKTIREGAEFILQDTGWSVDDVDDEELPEDQPLYSYEASDISALELLRIWANLTNRELVFSWQNGVSLVNQQGGDKNASFRYGKNLEEINYTFQPPQATRLYPVGANNLTIDQVWPTNYIEDYSWYEAQGVPPERLSLFRKDLIWRDESFITALPLLDAGVRKLQELSQPTISYECTVADLSKLTGLPEEEYLIGDTVRVEDETLGVDIRTRVVKLVRRPQEPWNNEIELAYLKPGITRNLMSTVSSGSGGGSEWKLLVDESDEVIIDTTLSPVCFIGFTSAANANGVVGPSLVGVAEGSGTLEVGVWVDNNLIGDLVTTIFSHGQRIDIGLPTWFVGLNEGAHSLTLRARVVEGGGVVNVNKFAGRLYVLMTGLLGGGALGNTIIYTGEVVDNHAWTALDSSTTDYHTDIGPTVNEAVPNEFGAPTDDLVVEIEDA